MEETDYARHLAVKKAKSDELLAKVALTLSLPTVEDENFI